MQIEVQHSTGPKEIFHIKKDTVVLGRSTKCDVQVSYPGISREHVLIEFKDGDLYITDLGSTNGVFIDGERLKAHQATPYQTYLQLVAGETSISLTLPLDKTGSIEHPFRGTSPVSRSERPTAVIQPQRRMNLRKIKKTTIMPYVFATALVGSTVLYYQSKESPPPAHPVAAVEEKKTFSIPANFEEGRTYRQLWDEDGCKSTEEKTICSQLKEVWFPKEHLLIKDKVYIFVNLTKEMSYRGLKQDDIKAMAQIILSNLTTHPLIRILEKPTYALGFVEANGSTDLKFVLTQNMKGIPVLDLQLHRSVFSRAMVGEEWLFQKIIQPDLAIKPL